MKHIVKISLLVFLSFFLINATIKQQATAIAKSGLHEAKKDSVVKIDKATGLIVAEGLELVTAHCTGCHSSRLITQFHTDRQGWLEKIRWMQQKQKLWDLGEAEPVILNYLAKNYPATETVNRRAALRNIEWYKLK
jgi:hypothetical protein